ncbi:MAG: saccharopine dehydrogenase NADP-binding domain-containing protein, partial [Candidatus Bathyarchaeota archaeon]|nr:saccharopine dehydrogenase NADP-binding domain-containing protein [Candidatus Bathyarchaeota archaeon]
MILGTGPQGEIISTYALKDPDIDRITVVDRHKKHAEGLVKKLNDPRADYKVLDVGKEKLADLFSEYDAVLNATSYKYNAKLTKEAIDAGVHFGDLGGNPDVMDEQKRLAENCDVAIAAACGIAPGSVSTVGRYGVDSFTAKYGYPKYLLAVVGGVPLHPTTLFKFGIMFSI